MIPWVISGWKEEVASRRGGGSNHHGQRVDEDEYMIWVSCVCGVVRCVHAVLIRWLFVFEFKFKIRYIIWY